MIDPSQFSNITGQIDYGSKAMPVNQAAMKNFKKEYGAEHGERAYYASVNAGKIKEGYEAAIKATEQLRVQQLRRQRRGT